MRILMIITAAVLAIGISESRAEVPLSSYADANGYLDVHKLTCEQLVNSSQKDADMLIAWFGGWYNGLAHKHFIHFDRGELIAREMFAIAKNIPKDEFLMHWPSCSRMSRRPLARRCGRRTGRGRLRAHCNTAQLISASFLGG